MPSKFFLVRWLEDESVTVLPIAIGAGMEAGFVGSVTDIKFGKKYYEGEILRISGIDYQYTYSIYSYSYIIFSGNRAMLSKLCNDLVHGRKTREEILEATEHASSVKTQDPAQESTADSTSSSTAKSSTHCKPPKASTKNMKRRKQLAQAHAAKEREYYKSSRTW